MTTRQYRAGERSDRQLLSVAALVIGVLVAGIVFAVIADAPFGDDLPRTSDLDIAKVECLADMAASNSSRADMEACNDAAERRLRVGPYEPWHERHPVLTALAAGLTTFFVIAAAGRLLLE